jgi:hypothetical protein
MALLRPTNFGLGLLLALAGVLTGCAALDRRQPPFAELDSVVGEAVQAARAPQAEQRANLARAQQTFMADASSLNRLRLAALLATLPEPLRDDARALELLGPLADAGVPGAARLAALLSAQITDRQRLARELERTAREREAERTERDKREDGLRQQAEVLREQLEALKAIEKNIREREEKLRRRQN